MLPILPGWRMRRCVSVSDYAGRRCDNSQFGVGFVSEVRLQSEEVFLKLQSSQSWNHTSGDESCSCAEGAEQDLALWSLSSSRNVESTGTDLINRES